MSDRVALPGSERIPMLEAKLRGLWQPDDIVTVTVHLKGGAQVAKGPQGQIQALSRTQFAQVHAARREDIDLVTAFAHDHGLDVAEIRPEERSVRLTGTVAQLNAAFGVTLERHEHANGVYRGRRGVISLPAAVAAVTSAVTGLDNRPVARPLSRRRASHPRAGARSFLPTELRKIYNFPSDSEATGKGQTVALIELVGPVDASGDQRCGYRAADIRAYFKNRLGFAKAPSLTSVSVDGARNSPTGDPNGADGEVALDIEVVGGIASGARIVVYFAPNTDDGFLNAIKRATHDAQHDACAISISWGAAEASWTEQSLREYDLAFQDAAALGISVFAAAGDDGAADGVKDGRLHVDFPASSPNVTACGGTHLVAKTDQTIASESVWQTNGATGGGVSDFFDAPEYQKTIDIVSRNPDRRRGRVLPDISANADPATGYIVSVDAEEGVIGGTSAVAPLFAGLIALLAEQKKERFGLLNPKLYSLGAQARVFRDITEGSNHGYDAGKGFDACTGWGSVDGKALGKAL